MGFYLKKSIRVGPVRFNLSKSGIGISGGVKGFRVGAGPRGTYVHMGRGGIYYRKTLSGGGAGLGNAHPNGNGALPKTGKRRKVSGAERFGWAVIRKRLQRTYRLEALPPLRAGTASGWRS